MATQRPIADGQAPKDRYGMSTSRCVLAPQRSWTTQTSHAIVEFQRRKAADAAAFRKCDLV